MKRVNQPVGNADRTVMIMAGGTGGHVFPALAVARRLSELGIHVEWLGTRRGIESRIIPNEHIPIHYIGVSGVRGKGLFQRLLAPVRILVAVAQSLLIIGRIGPDCVLGMGGFASGPGGVAAWLLRKPLLIHEQNAVAGLTNRLLARLATRVMVAFPHAFVNLAPQRVSCIGNPVRAEISSLERPKERFQKREGPFRVLVLGGSLGARALNRAVPKAVAMFAEDQRPEIWHQTGQDDCETTLSDYNRAGIHSRVDAFIDAMHEAYRWADLVVCRSGALTVSEISCAGLPAVFIPYPYAVDDHQTENARYLECANAAVVLPQQELTPQNLYQVLRELLSSRTRLLAMADKARSMAHSNAADQAADYCREACYV